MPSPTTTTDSPEGHRYRVTGVLGRGGFGTVFLARLEGGSGFVKDVAIKILSDDDPPPDVLGRFRDEARILGRLRDRNIVSVEPPSRLAGRWAVVMEYAAGADCRRLLTTHGSLPPLVAVEIVQEIARTLHNLWTHPGDDDAPMKLVHRDLKPSNVQLTPDGSVKLLDFGVATARIVREVQTTNHITGTVGYIAPERLDGVEDHAGDIYSLGIVLEELVLGTRPVKPGDGLPDPDVSDPAVLEAVSLARAMRSLEVIDRPNAEDVEHWCRHILKSFDGEDLRSWARKHVRPALVDADDPLVGQVIRPPRRRLSKRRQRSGFWTTPRALLAGMLAGTITLGLVMVVANYGARSLWGPVTNDSSPSPGSILPAAGTADVQPDPAPQDRGDPAPSDPAPSEPASAAPQPEPSPERAGDPLPKPEPTPVPVAAVPTPKPVAVAVTGDAEQVRFVSDHGAFEATRVPPGRYTVRATFPGGEEVAAGEIEIPATPPITLRCDRRFQRCLVR